MERGYFQCSHAVEFKRLTNGYEIRHKIWLDWYLTSYLCPEVFWHGRTRQWRDTEASTTSSELELETRAKWRPNEPTPRYGFSRDQIRAKVASTWQFYPGVMFPPCHLSKSDRWGGISLPRWGLPLRSISALWFSIHSELDERFSSTLCFQLTGVMSTQRQRLLVFLEGMGVGQTPR